jgi:diacylglycerol kinase
MGTALKSFFRSFTYAWNGMRVSLAGQRNLKVQFAIATITIGAGFYFRIDGIEWCLILFSIALVLSLEMVNSSIENLVDLVTLERKPLAGKIKDVAAGAVLVASVIAVIIGVIVFRKYMAGGVDDL